LSKLLLEKQSLGELDLKVWENIVNEKGDPRLAEARNYFLPLTADKIPTLVEAFQYWRDYHEYLLLKGENRGTGEELRLAVKCSKRGNDVYAKRLDMRLNFLDRLENVRFFDKVDFDKVAYAKSNLFWVTLSWDPKLCSLDEAWRSSYQKLHKFKANLENHYGKVEWLVFIQPFPNQNGLAYGYPHFHIVLWFKEAEFNVFPHLEKDKSGAMVLRYRVKEKREIELAAKWHSFIDVQALSSLRGAVSYVKKYAKSVCYGESSKAVLNGAVAWLYRKKSYSLTRGFQACMHDLISAMRVRKREFQTIFEKKGLDLSLHHGFPIWEWEFLGIRSAAEVGDPSGDTWVLEFDADKFDKLVRGR
jgi:hypothetical protein